jgi:hypothetical protein
LMPGQGTSAQTSLARAALTAIRTSETNRFMRCHAMARP